MPSPLPLTRIAPLLAGLALTLVVYACVAAMRATAETLPPVASGVPGTRETAVAVSALSPRDVERPKRGDPAEGESGERERPRAKRAGRHAVAAPPTPATVPPPNAPTKTERNLAPPPGGTPEPDPDPVLPAVEIPPLPPLPEVPKVPPVPEPDLPLP
jgi:hypothetical protein